jgi:hypothetical protein
MVRKRFPIKEQEMRGPSGATFLPAAIAAWCVFLVLDFLTHAIFLASWWRSTEKYWLPPRELFRLIPLGYTSFAIYCAALTWLLRRLYNERLDFATGLRFGAVAGLVSGTGSVLGTYSAFRMPISALLVWPASLTLDSTVAGAIAAWVLVAERPWRRVGLVFGVAVALFILGVVIQNLFFPTPADHLFP